MGEKYLMTIKDGLFFDKKLVHGVEEVTGHIMGCSFTKNDKAGELLRVHVVDAENFYCISMILKSRIAESFIRCIPNLNLMDEVTFNIKRRLGKDYLSMYQYGAYVYWYYRGKNIESDFFKQVVTDKALPIIERKFNPYPNNPVYKKEPPRRLQGGYFDDYASPKKTYNNDGDCEPWSADFQ